MIILTKLGLKILGIVGIISLISIVILITANMQIFKATFIQLQEDAVHIVEECLESIDAEKLEQVIKSQSMNDAAYHEVQQAMLEYKADHNINYFYTLARKDSEVAYILVDATLTNLSPLGEEYELEEAMIKAFEGKTAFTEVPVEDDYGTFISAYAPIKNSAGEIIAIAGVDIDVSYFLSIRSMLTKATAGIAVVLLALSVILSLLFSRPLSSGVKELNKSLAKFAEGDLTQAIQVDTKDEIQYIASSVDNVRKKTVGMLSNLREAIQVVQEGITGLLATS